MAYRDIADMLKVLRILNPWCSDAMLKNDIVPSSKHSSMPSLLLTKSMSAIDAATVPRNLSIGKQYKQRNTYIIAEESEQNSAQTSTKV